MHFNNINASIAHNANEHASLYLAFTLMRAIFRDVLEESGRTDISELDLGDGNNDEKLPNELIWFSNQILKIYSAHDDQLENNRKRLERAIAEIENIQVSLKEAQKNAVDITQKREEQELLNKKTEEEKADIEKERAKYKRLLEEYRSLCDSIKESQKELQELNGINIEEKRKDADAYKKQVEENRRQVSIAEKDLAKAKEEYEETEKKKTECEASSRNLADKKKALEDAIAVANNSITEYSLIIKDLEKEEKEKIEEKTRLEGEKTELEKRRDEALTQKENFENVVMKPLRESVAKKEEAQRILEEERESVNGRITELTNSYEDLVKELGDLRGRLEKKRAEEKQKKSEVEEKNTEEGQLDENLARLNKRLEELTERLGKLQTATDEAGKKKTAESARRLCDEIERAVKSAEDIDTNLKGDIERYGAECKILETEIDANEPVLNDRKRKYEELSTKVSENDETLKRLKDDIEKLENGGYEESFEELKKQLTQRKVYLAEKKNKCENELPESIEDVNREIETVNGKIEEYERIVEEKRRLLADRQRREQELAGSIDIVGIKEQIKKCLQRIEVLKQVAECQRRIIKSLNSALDENEAQNTDGKISVVQEKLEVLYRNLIQIQRDMVSYEEAIKLKENEL